MGNDQRFAQDVKALTSVIDKINTQSENVKFTKDEQMRLTVQLKENVKFLKKKADKSWFLVRWFHKSLYNQYNNILITYFKD
ncbi:MAG: hypothetical protein WCJ01_03020 [Ignavibacteria bacterium]